MSSRSTFRCLAAACIGVALAAPAMVQAADTWPVKPLRFITPGQPGTAADIAARALAQQLARMWSLPVVVDNRPSAGTIVASQTIANAAPDGYTFGLVLGAHTVNPSLYKSLPYDTLRDFAGVTLLYSLKSVIVAAPGYPANGVDDLVNLAKSKSMPLQFTSPLTGTIPHLLGEMFAQKYSLSMQHIGYKGSVAAHTDVVGGRVPVMFDILPGALPLIRDGKLKVLAVVGDAKAAELPNAPTLPGLLPPNSMAGWNGIVVPARTPRDVIDKLHASIGQAARSPEMQALFATMTVDTVLSRSPQEFDAFIRDEIARWGDVVRRAGIAQE